MASKPWHVEEEAGPGPNQMTFRLRVTRLVPADLITAVGDAVHNMRSALDAVAHEMARRHVGESLSEAQERATEFPITKDGDSFDAFFCDRRRDGLYGPAEIAALRSVQPFALGDEARALGVAVTDSPELTLKTDELYRLHQVSCIDKHRRLPIVALFPGLVYWTAPPSGNTYQWQVGTSPTVTVEDGTVLGYLTDAEGQAPPAAKVFHELRLALMDDPAFRRPIVEVLNAWYGYITGWVLPRVFAVADGNPAPLLISSGS